MHLFLFTDNTSVQSPSQFCSSERAPDITLAQLAMLSRAGLDAPSPTVFDVNNTPAQLEMRSKNDSEASSSINYDLNLTIEENEMNSREK